MELNKIAGAVLFALLLALVTSKIGNIVVPPYYAHAGADDHGGGTATTPTKKEPDPPFNVAINEATDARGKQLSNRCTSCHSFEKGGPNKVGPNLWGVIGRKKGSHPGYAYSAAMKDAGTTWTMEILYNYLKNPQAVVKGTKMAYRMPKPDQRGAIIRYLRTLSDNPVPLPKAEPAGDKKPAESKDGEKKDGAPKDGAKDDGAKDGAKDAPKKDDAKAPAPKSDDTKKSDDPTKSDDANKDAPKKDETE